MVEYSVAFSTVTRFQIPPELMACFGGTNNLGHDANNSTCVIVSDTYQYATC